MTMDVDGEDGVTMEVRAPREWALLGAGLKHKWE